MLIHSITLRNFRNLANQTVHFSQGINAICGENGVGKTNLLEALFLLSTGRSFRSNQLKDCIKAGEDAFFLEISFTQQDVLQEITIGFNGKEKRIRINGVQYPTFSSLVGHLPFVFINPGDIQLIQGNPNERRRFINLLLAQSDPLYVHHLIRYSHALKARNALLKAKKTDSIESWEALMAKSANYLVEKRMDLSREIQSPVSDLFQKLFQTKVDLSLRYRNTLQVSTLDEIAAQLKRFRSKDLQWGSTQIGPHRDDLHLQINQKDAKAFASEGQKRCILTATKLAEWRHLKEKTNCPPLFAMDDFSIHLDSLRFDSLLTHIETLPQVLITTPSDHNLKFFSKDLPLSKFFIDNGIVNPV